jgi:hypothetical protein
MKLPNGENARVDIAKLRYYCLNEAHEVGSHKARVFRAALGLTADDAEWLREKLLKAAKEDEAQTVAPSPFGTRYTIDVTIIRDEKTAVVRTTWIIEHGTDFPRLTSCYVIGE